MHPSRGHLLSRPIYAEGSCELTLWTTDHLSADSRLGRAIRLGRGSLGPGLLGGIWLLRIGSRRLKDALRSKDALHTARYRV